MTLKRLPSHRRSQGLQRVSVQLSVSTRGRRTVVWKKQTERDFSEQEFCSWQFDERDDFQNQMEEGLLIRVVIQYPQKSGASSLKDTR